MFKKKGFVFILLGDNKKQGKDLFSIFFETFFDFKRTISESKNHFQYNVTK